MSDPVLYLYWVSGRPLLVTGPAASPLHKTARHLSHHVNTTTWSSQSQLAPGWYMRISEKIIRWSSLWVPCLWLTGACHLSPRGWWVMRTPVMRDCHNRGVSWPWHRIGDIFVIWISHALTFGNQTQFVHYRVSWKDDATKLIFDGPGSGSSKYKVGSDHNKTHFYFQIALSNQTRYTGENYEKLSKCEEKSIYNPTAEIKFQKLQLLHFYWGFYWLMR